MENNVEKRTNWIKWWFVFSCGLIFAKILKKTELSWFVVLLPMISLFVFGIFVLIAVSN